MYVSISGQSHPNTTLYVGTPGQILALPLDTPGYVRHLLQPIKIARNRIPNYLVVDPSASTLMYSDILQGSITRVTTDVQGLVTQ